MTEEQTYPAGVADPTAEVELLGGLIRHPTMVADVITVVDTADTFTVPRHQDAWVAIVAAFQQGEEISVLELRHRMRQAGDADPDGLPNWLATLLSQGAVFRADVPVAARRLAGLARKRRYATTLTQTLSTVHKVDVDADDALAAVQAATTSLLINAPLAEALVRGTDALVETIDEIETVGQRKGLPGLSVGSSDLDEALQGLRPGQLVVVGGRPSIGKSVVAIDWVRAALEAGTPTLLFTLEMTRNQVGKRLLSSTAEVSYSNILSGRLSEDEWGRLSGTMGEVRHDLLTLVDRRNLTVGQIDALATQQARTWEATGNQLGLIVIDYLQIMRESSRKREISRQQALGEITVELKQLAGKLGVPVVLLAQVGRSAVRTADRVPTLADLRESGDIEANADTVVLLHRPDAFDPEDRPGEIDFILAKNREGEAKTVTRVSQHRLARHADMAYSG